ncbi:hypothetical protein [Halohasta salina]|nr:hypothetical protein [Halohasta salina]
MELRAACLSGGWSPMADATGTVQFAPTRPTDPVDRTVPHLGRR